MAVSRVSTYPEVELKYTSIKMEEYPPNEHAQAQARLSSSSSYNPAIPITTVVTANENWRGKNDPAERRRIQNRLNQRAFRQRRRAGESPKQYKRRSMSVSSSQQQSHSQPPSDDDEPDSPQPDDSAAAPGVRAEGPTSSTASAEAVVGEAADTQAGYSWDELGQLINRNFMVAAATNAQHLGLDLAALRDGRPLSTPRPQPGRPVPPALAPVELQHRVAHDPIIDTLPHARLRFNILHAIAAARLDARALSRCLRTSGALEPTGAAGGRQRCGVVVWSGAPEEPASWELSEAFVRRWGFLLQACDDLIAATNAWRSRRGERLFPYFPAGNA